MLILPDLSEATLAVGADGRVGLSEDFGDRALFVITPIAAGRETFWIRTATLRAGAEAWCLAVKQNGAEPMSVVTAGCDAADRAQSFTFGESGRNSEGNMRYTVGNGPNTYLVLDPEGEIDPGGGGLVARDIGDERPDTTFLLVDRGKASMPTLD